MTPSSILSILSIPAGISSCTALTMLSCGYNLLGNLNVSNNSSLTELWVPGNQLTSLDVSTNTALTVLHCEENQLFILDVSKNTALCVLHCGENQLISLDVSNCTALADLECWDNYLTILDVSNNTELVNLRCAENHLDDLDVSSNTDLEYLDISFMPSLGKVCVWTEPFPPAGVDVDTTGSQHVYFTSEGCVSGIVENNPSLLSIYPNPFADYATVRLSDADRIRRIEIMDMYGRTVRTIDDVNNNSVTIHRGKLPVGIYFIRIQTDDTFIRKAIIR